MYYLINVDHNGMAVHLTRSECEGFLRSTVYPVQWVRMMMICCGKAVKRVGVRTECEEDESTNCEDGDSDTDW